MGREAVTEVRLAPGEHALVGYGSLLSVASMERTLGRKYDGPWHVCHLRGWKRGWDICMPNDAWKYRQNQHVVTAERVLYLNVRRQEGGLINAALFVIQGEELRHFDEREWIYERQRVNDDLEDVKVIGGDAWMYVALEKYLWRREARPPEAVIRQTYLDILERGQVELGLEFRREYEATTDPAPVQLVVEDFRE